MRLRLPRGWSWPRPVSLSRLRPVLLGAPLFLVCFLLGFYAAFPDSVLRQRVLGEVNRQLPPGHRLEAGTVRLGFPLRLQIFDARLILPNPALPEVPVATVSLGPTWSTLVGTPGLTIAAESAFGHLDGTVTAGGVADLHLADGRFDQPIPELGQLRLRGRIVALDLVGQLQLERDEPLRCAVELTDLVLQGADQLGLGQESLPLGDLNARLDGTGRTLQIEQLGLAGGDVVVNGSGRLILQQPLAASRADLKLTVRPGAAAGSGLRTLLDLLGPATADGAHELTLRGRLLALQMN